MLTSGQKCNLLVSKFVLLEQQESRSQTKTRSGCMIVMGRQCLYEHRTQKIS